MLSLRLLPCLASALVLCCGISLGISPAWAGDAPGLPDGAIKPLNKPDRNTLFVNSKVSSRAIGVNQAVRIEFTTQPRQVEGIDVISAVTNGLALNAGATWRLLGKPSASEAEKTKTITVTFSVMPRVTGDLDLPSFPLTWLATDAKPDFGKVTVTQRVVIGGADRPLPSEFDGVGGFLWGLRLSDALDSQQLAKDQLTTTPERTAAKLTANLELGFRVGELTDAVLIDDGLPLEAARASFCERWGLPVSEEGGTLMWILGWTRITATATAGKEASGVRLELVREDLLAKQAQATVRSRVFSQLEGEKK